MLTQGEPISSDAHGELEARRFRSHWALDWIPLFLIVAVFCLYWPTASSLIREWEDTQKTTYTHGYLIGAISLWLMVRNRQRIKTSALHVSWGAAITAGVVSLLWLVALRAGIQIVHQMLLPILMWLAVCAICGRAIAIRCAFPIAYLYFAIPFWDEVNFILQGATVAAVDFLLRLTGVHAYVEGNIVQISGGVFEIAGGCSGLHFFIVALAIAALYGEINRDSVKVRLQLLALAVALGILTNWLRVYIIILAGDLTQMQHYLVRVEHYRFGWVLFAITMVAYFLIARRLPVTHPTAVSEVAPPSAWRDRRLTPLRGLLIGLPMLVGPVWLATAGVPADRHAASASFFGELTGWSGPNAMDQTQWTAEFVGADNQEWVTYTDGQTRVEAFSALYLYQHQGRELIGYENSLTGDAQIVSTSHGASPDEVGEIIVEKGQSQRWMIRYFYEVGGWRTTRPIAAQLAYGIGSLAGEPSSRIIAARVRCQAECTAARLSLDSFLHTLMEPDAVSTARSY